MTDIEDVRSQVRHELERHADQAQAEADRQAPLKIRSGKLVYRLGIPAGGFGVLAAQVMTLDRSAPPA